MGENWNAYFLLYSLSIMKSENAELKRNFLWHTRYRNSIYVMIKTSAYVLLL